MELKTLKMMLLLSLFYIGIVSVLGGNTCSLYLPLPQECNHFIVDSSLRLEFEQISFSSCSYNVDQKGLFKNAPIIFFEKAKQDVKYTLSMVDPDAPSHADGESYLHWIVSNINGKDFANGDISKGFVVTDYAPPTPPNGTNVHRYITYIFEEPLQRLDPAPPSKISKRRKFILQEYASERGICGPIDFNIFRTQF